MEQRLEADGLLDLYRTLELPLTPVLAQMEARGVAIDAAAFQSFLSDVQGEIDRLTQEVFAAAGTTFNIRSAQQLGEVLFNTLKLPSPRKTRGGQASTNQETLEKLAGQHPVVESILQFRKLEKMRSTYLDPLPRLVDPRGRIHTTFNQKATATGRLSSSNPNLQNIPVRGPLGKRMWFVEDHEVFDYWKAYAPLYDVFAVIQKEPFLSMLSGIGQGNALYLPLAAQPDFHKPLELTEQEKREYGADIGFLGAGYPNRRLAFRQLVGRDFKIWGSDWDGESLLAPHVQRGSARIDADESVKIYNATRVNLNLHSSLGTAELVSKGDFVNPRTFELA